MERPAKRRREGEGKQELLRWLFTNNCPACFTARYSANADALAAVKKDHLDGRHEFALAASASGDTIGAVAASEEGMGATSSSAARVTGGESFPFRTEPFRGPAPASGAPAELSTPVVPAAALAAPSHAAGMEPSTPARPPPLFTTSMEAACKLLRTNACSANQDVFLFQQPLIRVITHKMPANDKFDSEQVIRPWMKRAVKKAVEPVRSTKRAYRAQANATYGELQDRPHMAAIFTGLKAIMPTSKQIAATESSVKYVEKVRNPDGTFTYAEKKASPPPHETEAAHETSSEQANKRWVMDIVMFARLGGAWCVDGVPQWIPRAISECKWSLKPEDVYQVALGGARLCLDRLRRRLPIDRMYLKVWAKSTYRYCILDVFGYVTLKDGRVTNASYETFQMQVSDLRERCGDSFQEEAFKDAPTSVENIEKLFREREVDFMKCYSGIRLPSEVLAPVGVLYINPDTRPFPSGSRVVKAKDANLFYQGMLRVLGSNSVLGWSDEQLETNIREELEESIKECPMVEDDAIDSETVNDSLFHTLS